MLYLITLKRCRFKKNLVESIWETQYLKFEDEHKGKNFCRNKAPLNVSHSKNFILLWFNSNNIQHHIKNMVTLYEQGRRGEKITSAKGQYFKNSQASLLSFMRCFMAIVLFWLVIFFYNCVRPFRTLEWCNFFPSTQRKHKTKKMIS